MATATAVSVPQAHQSTQSRSIAGSMVYSATIFLGAFLLFQVQLIAGKYLLPWFGGTTGVWATCLLFFQVLLLAGYSYVHWLSSRYAGKRGSTIHQALIAVSILILVGAAFVWRSPIMPGESWKPQGDIPPVLAILRLLALCVGLPFFILSTTGPLIQRWFANNYPNSSPYRLYTLSNLGSLLGLLSYPFLLEPVLRLSTQGWLWCTGYALYAVGVIICGRRADAFATNASAPETLPLEQEQAPDRKRFLMWVGLAACASTMLLAVTQTICQDVAVIPLLWVLPLCVYLISFIICFDHERWYQRGFFHFLLAATLLGTLLVQRTGWMNVWPTIALYLLVLFACCMFCHGEVYRSRPAPRYLTVFYLSVALGGALGGIFVNLVGPLIFRGYWELHVGLFACFGAMIWMVLRDKHSWVYRNVLWLPVAILLWAYWAAQYLTDLSYVGFDQYMGTLQAKLLLAVAALVTVMAGAKLRPGHEAMQASQSTSSYKANIPRMVTICLLLALMLTGGELWFLAGLRYRFSIWSERNFYGVLYVMSFRLNPLYASNYLLHGQVQHGVQLQGADVRRIPTAYFGHDTGVGLLLLNHPKRKTQPPTPMRVGVIGLGVGTLAAYGRPGDVFRFYEINPAVIEVASSSPYFSFIRDSEAQIQTVEGDGRMSLERELSSGGPQKYDVLVVDGFNGDSIPVHLLTKEAFELYSKHLRGPESVIAVNITNKMLRLATVVARLASHLNLHCAYVVSRGVAGNKTFERSEWMLLSASPEVIEQPAIAKASSPLPETQIPLWTDEYSNLLRLF